MPRWPTQPTPPPTSAVARCRKSLGQMTSPLRPVPGLDKQGSGPSPSAGDLSRRTRERHRALALAPLHQSCCPFAHPVRSTAPAEGEGSSHCDFPGSPASPRSSGPMSVRAMWTFTCPHRKKPCSYRYWGPNGISITAGVETMEITPTGDLSKILVDEQALPWGVQIATVAPHVTDPSRMVDQLFEPRTALDNVL